jgi:hypothetical protein
MWKRKEKEGIQACCSQFWFHLEWHYRLVCDIPQVSLFIIRDYLYLYVD